MDRLAEIVFVEEDSMVNVAGGDIGPTTPERSSPPSRTNRPPGERESGGTVHLRPPARLDPRKTRSLLWADAKDDFLRRRASLRWTYQFHPISAVIERQRLREWYCGRVAQIRNLPLGGG